MLTIKRRSEKRTLYLYSSAAVIVGFAGIMTFLVQTNANLSEFASVGPTQSEPTKVTPATEENSQAKTEEANTPSNADTTASQNWTVPVMQSNNTAPTTPVAPAAPAQEVQQPAPVTTTPEVPTTPVVEIDPITGLPIVSDVVDAVTEVVTP